MHFICLFCLDSFKFRSKQCHLFHLYSLTETHTRFFFNTFTNETLLNDIFNERNAINNELILYDGTRMTIVHKNTDKILQQKQSRNFHFVLKEKKEQSFFSFAPWYDCICIYSSNILIKLRLSFNKDFDYIAGLLDLTEQKSTLFFFFLAHYL